MPATKPATVPPARSAPVSTRFGTIVMPAAAIMDLQEGTIEAWVKLNFDPQHHSEARWRSVGSLCALEVPKTDTEPGALIHVGWGQQAAHRHNRWIRYTTLRAAFVKNGVQLPHPVMAHCNDWGEGQWHHIAIVWKDGRDARSYVDGQKIGWRYFPWSAARSIPSTARLVIGATMYINDNAISVDEIRISSIARKPEDLGFHHVPLRPDPFTLYLENFEQVTEANGKRFTRPFLAEGGEGAFEVLGGVIVAGKQGQGYSFRLAPDQPQEEKKEE